jgi:hypothetical protein
MGRSGTVQGGVAAIPELNGGSKIAWQAGRLALEIWTDFTQATRRNQTEADDFQGQLLNIQRHKKLILFKNLFEFL